MREQVHTAAMASRAKIVRIQEDLLNHVARHCDAAVEAARQGHISRADAIDELHWVWHNLPTAEVNDLTRRAGARLPVEGTGVLQW